MKFEKVDKSIISGLAATSIMTLVSYGISKLKKQNLVEPEILGGLLQDFIANKKLARPVGWTSHYVLGLEWALLMEMVFQNTKIKRSIVNGLILGGISGVAGIITWNTIFRSHHKPRFTNLNLFYKQLILAHIAFMLTYVLLYKDNAMLKQLAARLPIA